MATYYRIFKVKVNEEKYLEDLKEFDSEVHADLCEHITASLEELPLDNFYKERKYADYIEDIEDFCYTTESEE